MALPDAAKNGTPSWTAGQDQEFEPNPKRGSVYLELAYRNWLFLQAYQRAGSLSEIANQFHYVASAGKNGAIRDMWIGRKGIPFHHLSELASLAGVSFGDLEEHRIEKHANIEQSDWMKVVAYYGRNVSPPFEDFRRSFHILSKQLT